MLQTPEDQDQEQEQDTHQLAAQSSVAHTPGASADVELMRSHISQHGKQQQEEMQQLQLFPAQESPLKKPLSQVQDVSGQAEELEQQSTPKRLGRRQEDAGDLEAGLSERQVRVS